MKMTVAVTAIAAGLLLAPTTGAEPASPAATSTTSSSGKVGPFHPLSQCQNTRYAYIKKGYTVTSGCYLAGWAYYFNVGKGPASR